MDATSGHMMNQYIYDSSLSMSDTDIERRPYHRNCSCALHMPKAAPAACFQHGYVAFPKKQSWSNCSVSITSVRSSTRSSHICALSGIANESAVGNFPCFNTLMQNKLVLQL
ncbi:Cyclophilin-like peptidyl-prolyl cis-trans isomerase family protein [Heracleum sosnowskyi]|uniref:Cyclophilin-like peptidyl-prolyl cis-trans isomerase family protein n=1 Tax=Heracleum sosnowskyi TaxID=360622 RepID=A0AAD8JF92_9APIA|nr:Cyclophilin-like peptidyl-prolyl cis-trans isomerase family protein [Heracleum sosnowskyi]